MNNRKGHPYWKSEICRKEIHWCHHHNRRKLPPAMIQRILFYIHYSSLIHTISVNPDWDSSQEAHVGIGRSLSTGRYTSVDSQLGQRKYASCMCVCFTHFFRYSFFSARASASDNGIASSVRSSSHCCHIPASNWRCNCLQARSLSYHSLFCSSV